jgi:acyl-CoA oxidase
MRSLDNNLPLKGVEVGELGVKMGYNGLDNGYATFDHVRIHRMNLLMKHATVTRDGLYAANQHRDQLVYGRMLGGRIHLLLQCAFQFAQATTITARYSVVRRQGYGPYNKNGPEKTILHYGSQQYRLMSIIAKSYAVLFTWQVTVPVYKDMLERLVKNDHSALPHVHALSCGLKAWAAQNSFEGAEEARKMCGGHGYSVMSGLLAIIGNLGATCTLEGENWVMWQQTASYLVKGLSTNKLPAGMEYLGSYYSDRSDRLTAPCSAHSDDFLSSDTVRRVFEHRAACLIFEICAILSTSSLPKPEAWDKYMMLVRCVLVLFTWLTLQRSLIQAACAHIELYVLNAFISIVSNVSDRTIRTPLQDLLILFALTTIITPPAYSPTFFLDNYLSAVQRREILEQIDYLLKRLVPNIIGLTDAWNFSDANLASAIGCYDGNAHERLIRWARQLPINSKNTHVKLLDEIDTKSTGGPAQAKL